MFSTLSHSLSGNAAIAQELLVYAGERRFWAFTGDLGAGKTTFIQSLCRELGVEEAVTSPTFALVNTYDALLAPGGVVHHFDMYRIKHEEEAWGIGMQEYIESGSYCLVEWPEMIPSVIPAGVLWVRITALEDGMRRIEAV
jgi:tRNA threonylcarbamoyladenosine biosynthesis protein TsaE